MNTALIIKACVDLAIALSFQLSATPPNAPVSKDELSSKSLFERSIQARLILKKTFAWSVAIIDVIYASYNQRIDRVHALAIFCAIASVTGNLWRLWAFAALGKMFDFEFRIQKNHQLITTGPYAYIRHPSYTGLFVVYISFSVVILTPGHWFRDLGMMSPVGMLAGCYWFFDLMLTLVSLTKRMSLEDDGLRGAFGKDWDQYAEATRYRLIPGIY